MQNRFAFDPVFWDYALRVQKLLEANNDLGLSRKEIGESLEGAPPDDPQARVLYEQRVLDHAEEKFDRVKTVCRIMFDSGVEEWGFIWFRQIKREFRYHVAAKVVNGFRAPILSFYPAGQIAQRHGACQRL
jgi:hypothetical protein